MSSNREREKKDKQRYGLRNEKHQRLIKLLYLGDSEARKGNYGNENPIIKTLIGRGEKVDDGVLDFLERDELLEKIHTKAAMDDAAKLAENEAAVEWYELLSIALDDLAENPEDDGGRKSAEERLTHGIVLCFLNGISADDCEGLLSEERLRDSGAFLKEVTRRIGGDSIGAESGDADEAGHGESDAEIEAPVGQRGEDTGEIGESDEDLEKLEDAFRLVNEGKKAECMLRMELDDAKRKLTTQRKELARERRKCNEYARKYNGLLKENEELRMSLDAAERNVTRLSVIDEEYEKQKSAIDNELESALNEIKRMVDKVASEDSVKKSGDASTVDDAFGVMSYSNNTFLGYINKLRDIEREMRDGSAEAVSDTLNALGCEQTLAREASEITVEIGGDSDIGMGEETQCVPCEKSPYTSLEEMLDDLYSLDDEDWIKDAYLKNGDEIPDGVFLSNDEGQGDLWGDGDVGNDCAFGNPAEEENPLKGCEEGNGDSMGAEPGAIQKGAYGETHDASIENPASANTAETTAAWDEYPIAKENDGNNRSGVGSISYSMVSPSEAESFGNGVYGEGEEPIADPEKADGVEGDFSAKKTDVQEDPAIHDGDLDSAGTLGQGVDQNPTDDFGGQHGADPDMSFQDPKHEEEEKENAGVTTEVQNEDATGTEQEIGQGGNSEDIHAQMDAREDGGQVLGRFDDLPEEGTFTKEPEEDPGLDLTDSGERNEYVGDADPGNMRFEVVGKEKIGSNADTVSEKAKWFHEKVMMPYGRKHFSEMGESSQRGTIVAQAMSLGFDDEGKESLSEALDSCRDADERLRLLSLVSRNPSIEEIREFANSMDAEV